MAIAVYSVGRISGAHINPAVTVSLAAVGSFQWSLVPGYIAAQIAGAFAGAVVVWLAYHPHWEETHDPEAQLAVFCTAPAIRRTPANLTCEAIGTALLLFGILVIGANASLFRDPGGIDLTVVFSTGLNPLLVGFLVWGIGLSLGGPTGYAINPARDLGPRLAHALLPLPHKGSSDWSYSWVPVVGPLVGSLLGAFAFTWLGA